MEVQRNDIDSEVLQAPVLEIADFDPAQNFADFEGKYVRLHRPLYATCKIPAEEIEHIHLLEDHGFRFIEFQLRLRGSLTRLGEAPAGYDYLPVTQEHELRLVLEIASSIFEHGRFSRDPFFKALDSGKIAGERYRRYVQKSAAAADEHVYKLVNNETGEIVGFGTHRILSPDHALLLIGGVKNEYKGSGLGLINDKLGLAELKRKGMRWFYTHVSGANYPIMNLEVRALGFRVVCGFVVLRKTYAR